MRSIRLSIIGNPDSVHVSRWARHFAQRGFDVTLLSFYQSSLDSAENFHLRYLRPRGRGGSGPPQAATRLRSRLVEMLPGTMRMVTAARFSIAGFRKQLHASRPDIVHGHYLSDYAFIAATGGVRPLVTSAWGSDVLRDPRESLAIKQIVRWVIGRSALITYNADALAEACTRLGARADQLVKVVMGVDSAFLDATKRSPAPSARPPVIVSHRSLDRTIFNVDVIIAAMPEVVRRVPDARLLIGNSGRLEPDLRALASRLGVDSHVQFIGRAADELELADRLGHAAVYVSIPDTDGSSVTLLQAMAARSFPVVSDIPSNREWIGREGGAVVPLHDAQSLATALADALLDAERRERAAERNREVIAQDATWDRNMDRMEQAYRQLV